MAKAKGNVYIGDGKMGNLKGSGEQYLVTSFNDVDEWHLERYRWSKQFVKDKTVLDCACGCGYGSSILAEAAEEVHGYDKDAIAISVANEYWSNPNTFYKQFDLVNDAIDRKFDVIVSLETLEHLPTPIKETIETFKNALEDKGILCVSHPIEDKNKNVFHLHRRIEKDFVIEFMRKLGFTILFNAEQCRNASHRFRYIVGQLI